MDELVSIIIPVFNMEKLIQRCLDSVLEQTYKTIEIIIIDDGSIDNSGSICDKYAERDKRIIVIHQENKGIGGAYETAFKTVSGRYILFVDSDDYVSNNIVEKLLNLLKTYNADISQCCCTYVDYKRKNIKRTNKNRNEEILVFKSNAEIIGAFLDDRNGNTYFQRNVASKLYKRELFDEVKFIEGIQFIDIILLFNALTKCQKCVWTSDAYYFVYMRPDSVSRGMNSNRHIEDSKYYIRIMENKLKESYPQFLDYIDYYHVKFSMLHYNEVYRDNHISQKRYMLNKKKNEFLEHYKKCLVSQFYKNSSIVFKLEVCLFRLSPKLDILCRAFFNWIREAKRRIY